MRSFSVLRYFCLFFLGIFGFLGAGPVLAQVMDAETAFAEALQLRDAGDEAGALRMAETAAVRGHVRAAVLAADLLQAAGGEDNLREAVEYYRIAAGADDADALFRLGLLAREGVGGLSPALAASYLERAGEAGRAEAQYERARLYLARESSLYNPEHGLSLLRLAASSGVVVAQRDLGLLLAESGDGLPPMEAAQWLTMAATAGDMDAAYAAGLVLSQRGDVPGAVEAYRIAAEYGRTDAAAELGWLLYREHSGAYRLCVERDGSQEGRAECRAGVDRDAWRDGVDWLRMAAIGGDAVGRFRYAWALAEGPDGVVEQDLESAYRWILLAEAAGIADYGAAGDAAKIKFWLEGELDPGLIARIEDTPLFVDEG